MDAEMSRTGFLSILESNLRGNKNRNFRTRTGALVLLRRHRYRQTRDLCDGAYG